jgi:hypothetical protein
VKEGKGHLKEKKNITRWRKTRTRRERRMGRSREIGR